MLYAINVFKYKCICHNGHAVVENIKLNNSSLHYFAFLCPIASQLSDG